jgi:hypothetical protein
MEVLKLRREVFSEKHPNIIIIIILTPIELLSS